MNTILAALAFITFAFVPNGNNQVKLDISASHKQFKPASTGKIFFRFTPIEGIHINTDPPVEIQFEKNSSFEFVGLDKIETDEHGYFNAKKPLTYTFKITKDAKIGTYTAKGNIQYFFCSDKDGLCNRAAEKFEVKIVVTK